MKKLISKSVLFLGTVCLCFLGLLNLQQSMEVQASTFSVNSASTLVSYCARTGTHTINLTANIDLYEIVTIDRDCNITINGNGYTITQKGPENTFKIESGGSLTISNTTVDRSLYPDNAVCFWVEEGGNLTVNSGTYKASNSTVADIGVKELHGATVVGGFGMVTINGGTFTGSMADFYAVGLGGQYNYVINGGEFTNSTSGVGISLTYHPYKEAKNSVTINGGNFHHNKNNGITVGCPSGSQAGTTTATVNGGSFHDNGLNGISVIDVNQTCSIKRADIYNNKYVGVLTGGGTVEFISTSADAADLNIYNNGVITGYHNVYVQSGGKFIGGYANIYNNGSYLDKSTGIGVNLGTVTVKEGISIKDCKGGVQTFGSSAVVTIDGGYINGCTTGVNLDYGGTCTINNANITGNGVGIDADMGAVLEVTKGTITNNTTGIWCEWNSTTTIAGSSAGAVTVAGNSSEGILVTDNAVLNASNMNVFGGGGYNSQSVGVRINTSKSAVATISGNLYSNIDGVSVQGGTANVNANLYSNTDSGVYITGGTCNVTGGNIYGNKNGLWCSGGTITSKANLYNNSISGAFVNGANCSLTGGNVYGNVNGIECKSGTATSSTAIYSNTSRGVYAYNTGVCNVTNGNIYGNDTAMWVKGTATISVSKANVYNNGYGLYAQENGTLNANGSSAGAINIMGNDDVGIYVGGAAKATVSNANIFSGNGYNAQKVGVTAYSSQSVTLGSNTNIYSHTSNGVNCFSGTTTSVASVYSNEGHGVSVVGATFVMNGGGLTSNKSYGLYLISNSKATVAGGNIASNSGAFGDVYDGIADFTLTGTYGGRSSVNGYVYLANSDNYVKTASSSTLIKVRPSTYYSGRVVINTSSASYATTQERSTLYPNGSWILKKSGVNVVLARIPSIWYDGKEITGTLNLPSADGWYNANTVTSIGRFTAKDEDKDLTSFVMKYEGQVVASGTKDSSGDMHITYDFKHEGIRTYTLTATDSLGNSVTRTVIVKVDLTPPDIVDVDGTELDYGQSGEEPTFKWSVVVVDPDVPFRQRGEDELSGVANISLMPYSDQTEILKRVYDSPHIISATLSDYPDEKGLVIKVIDKAGNAAYKCLLSYDMLDIKVEPFYPR